MPAAGMDSPGVAREIVANRALATIFQFRGTPGLVVDRTVVNGVIHEAALALM